MSGWDDMHAHDETRGCLAPRQGHTLIGLGLDAVRFTAYLAGATLGTVLRHADRALNRG